MPVASTCSHSTSLHSRHHYLRSYALFLAEMGHLPNASRSAIKNWVTVKRSLLLTQLERVLDDPRSGGWMRRWFDVLKETHYHPVCARRTIEPLIHSPILFAPTRLTVVCPTSSAGGLRAALATRPATS